MFDNVTTTAYNITVAAFSHTGPSRNNPSVRLGMYIRYWSRAQTACASRRENGSGERSGISWAHYPEVVKTNEIVRLLLICSTSLQQENLFTSIVYLYSYFFWSGFSVLNVGSTVAIRIGSPDRFSSCEREGSGDETMFTYTVIH